MTSVTDVIIDSLQQAGVRYAFGVPGAKIDGIFNGLHDHPQIKLIVCRHEQNAAFMAAAVGRITGIPGVAISTSGPGASNLTTGLATATTEGDPVVALVGSVTRAESHSHTHQSMRTLEILGGATKYGANLNVPEEAAAVILAAFRSATADPKGAAVVSIPSDVAALPAQLAGVPKRIYSSPALGPAPNHLLDDAVTQIQNARRPIMFLGQRAGASQVVAAVRHFLTKHPIPVIETFQAAGAMSKELAKDLYFGRVGLFRNQVGDHLLKESDLVICIGYDPTEYTPDVWNGTGKLKIIHVDTTPCDYNTWYSPQLELVGSLIETLSVLEQRTSGVAKSTDDPLCQKLLKQLQDSASPPSRSAKGLVHPLHFVEALQARVGKDTTVCVDVGTCYIYMMRYFRAYEPCRLLSSDGQQTLGVGLPWAIASSLIQDPPCSEKVISISGDGGFMFSSQEMSTAVQNGCNITHFVWNSQSYNMVEFQEDLKYGRSSGISLGGVDFCKFAESFGAKGFRVSDASELEGVMDEALSYKGVSLVEFMVDYSDAKGLAGDLVKDSMS